MELRRGASRARGIGLDVEVLGPDEALALMPAASARVAATARSGSPATAASTRTPRPTPSPTPPAPSASSIRTAHARHRDRARRRARGAGRRDGRPGRSRPRLVVNACGIWAPQVAAMVGAFTPSVPVDHQHIALAGGGRPRAAARHALLPRHRQPRLRQAGGGRRRSSAATSRTRSRAGWTACRGITAAAPLPPDHERFAQLMDGRRAALPVPRGRRRGRARLPPRRDDARTATRCSARCPACPGSGWRPGSR